MYYSMLCVHVMCSRARQLDHLEASLVVRQKFVRLLRRRRRATTIAVVRDVFCQLRRCIARIAARTIAHVCPSASIGERARAWHQHTYPWVLLIRRTRLTRFHESRAYTSDERGGRSRSETSDVLVVAEVGIEFDDWTDTRCTRSRLSKLRSLRERACVSMQAHFCACVCVCMLPTTS